MVQRYSQYLQITALLAILWVVLHEELSVQAFATGAAVGTVAVFLTNRLVLRESYRRRYFFRSGPAVLYIARLLWEIYAAGFEAVYRMVTGTFRVGLVDVYTDLTDDLAIALLANSITLTPGTVTLAQNGQHLKVIWLTVQTRDPEAAGELIKGTLERHLRKVVVR